MRTIQDFYITCWSTFQLVGDDTSKNFSRIAWRYGDRLHRHDISDEYIGHSVEFRSGSVRIAIQCKSHMYLIVNDDFYTLYYPDTVTDFDSVEVSGIKKPIVTYTYGSDKCRMRHSHVRLFGTVSYVYDLSKNVELGVYRNSTKLYTVITPSHVVEYNLKCETVDYDDTERYVNDITKSDVSDVSSTYYFKRAMY